MSTKRTNPKYVFLLIVGALSLLWAVSYINSNLRRSRAAVGPNGVNIAFSPSFGTFAPGVQQTVTVTVTPITGTNQITGFDLTFDANNVQFVSATKATGFGDELFHTVGPSQIRLARTVGTSGTPQAVATFQIVFTGTANGPASINVNAAKSEVVGTLSTISFDLDTSPIQASYTIGTGGGGATNTPTPPVGGATNTPTPTTGGGTGNVTLSLKLKFQGITTKPKLTNTEQVQVKLLPSGAATPVTATGTFTPDDTGVYSGNVSFQVTPGSGYTLFVKGPRHLQKKICVAAPVETSTGTYRCTTGSITIAAGANTFDLSKILMLVGDLPQQDGIVDSYDTSFVRQSLGSSDPNKVAVGDLNRDGVIDTQDMSLIIQSLNVKYDEQ